MTRLFNFTQYYLVSMIIPGLFNAFSILYAFSLTCDGRTKCSLENYEWALISIFGIVMTLSIGMLIERPIYWVINIRNEDRIKNEDRPYGKFSQWRNRLIKKIQNNSNDDLIRKFTIENVEKLMAEYYCFNNIII